MGQVFCTSCGTAVAAEDAFCRACGSPQAGGRTDFDPMPPLQLALLCAGTFGLYVFVWFRRQWRARAQATGETLRSSWRALFFPVTAYALFEAVNEALAAHGSPGPIDRTRRLPARGLALVLMGLTWAAPLLLPAPWKLLWLLGFVPLMPVQAAINRLAPAGDRQAARTTRVPPWLAVAMVPGLALVLYLGAGFSGLVPPEHVIAGRMLSERQDALVRRLAGLDAGETIEYFFSASLFSYAEDGNVVTNRRLVSYFQDGSGHRNRDWVEYGEIRSLHVLYGGGFGLTTIVACVGGGDALTLYSSGDRAQDRQVIAAIRKRLFPRTLFRVETRDSFTCKDDIAA